jgi:O-antigen ligase
MSDVAAAPVLRPGIPGFIAAWPQSRFWLLSVDVYPALAAAALPWSTSAVCIFAAVWLAIVLPTIHWPAFFESLRAPARSLPLAFFALALLGVLWASDTAAVKLLGLSPVVKLLAIPLLIYHYQRSERGHWVLIAFLASCVLLMGVSWATYFADWKPSPNGMAGVPVRNYIDQSHELALCLFAVAPLLLSFAANGHRAWAIALAAIMLGFYCDMRFVATSRTTLVCFPVLLVLFAFKFLNRRHAIYLLVFAAIVEGAVLFTSPYLRDRVERTVQDSQVTVDSNAATPAATSNGLRLAYWRTSIRSISEAPVFGHGTGSTKQLFEREAEGKTGEWGWSIRNPHNQTLYAAIQWGVLGCLVLYAMWYFHLQLFRGSSFAAWVGLVIVVQNFVSSLFNSHLFDFHEGWIYVLGVGVAGGMVARAQSQFASGRGSEQAGMTRP